MKRGFYWKLALTNIKNHRQVYLPYLLSSVGIAMMFYMLGALGPSIREDEMYGGTTVATVMALGQIVIGVFAVLFLFYTNSFIMKRRKKELGLYNILGMEKWHIAKVIFRETLLTAVSVILLGLGLGVLFSKAMFLLLGKMLSVELPIAFTVPLSALSSTVILFLCIFLVTMLYNILQVKLSKPIELLRGGETGEKEPKAHWLLAVLGALLLGGGYYLAVSITSPLDALMWFFAAVILVIFGTYLLFITGITALLKLLKKNKRFYYKANHFTTVSGMLYRMKQNAAGLASICILFTCLLVTVSTTFSLYTGMEHIIRDRYPRNIAVNAWEINDAGKDFVRQTVAEVCEKEGVSPENIREREYFSWTVARSGNEFSLGEEFSTTYGMIEFYTQEEFERFSGEEVDLKDDEILLGDPRHTFPEGEDVVFNGAESDVAFHIVPTDYEFAEGELMAMIYETYYMVIPSDEALLPILYENTEASLETELNPRRWYYGFDVDADPDVISGISFSINTTCTEKLPQDGVAYERLSFEDSVSNRWSFQVMYGGLFFVGLFLGVVFLLGTALIIYYKQVSEGYEDARRFRIMQQVGMSRREVKKSIHSQILTVFFLPLLTAVLHLAFAFPMLQKILYLMNMVDFWLLFWCTVGCVLVFGVVYAVIYLITARTYYKIVEADGQERR